MLNPQKMDIQMQGFLFDGQLLTYRIALVSLQVEGHRGEGGNCRQELRHDMSRDHNALYG